MLYKKCENERLNGKVKLSYDIPYAPSLIEKEVERKFGRFIIMLYKRKPSSFHHMQPKDYSEIRVVTNL